MRFDAKQFVERSYALGAERCGRPYSHEQHGWLDGIDKKRCDGGSDEVDAQEANAHADELFEAGFYEDAS